MTAIERVLERLTDVHRNGTGWAARCPAHDDRRRSLSLHAGEDGRVLLICFAGCVVEAVVRAAGLELRDLFERRDRGGGAPIPPDVGATLQHSPAIRTSSGCTLARYAEAKRLPLDFLRACGLSEVFYEGRPAIRIPYRDAVGTETAVRFRLELAKSDAGDNRFRWKNGAKPSLYGLWRLEDIRTAGYVVLVEGESDAQTLWRHGEPALGVPGATNWREDRDAERLDGISLIYVVVEPDAGGDAVRAWLATSRIRDRVRLVELGAAKDPSALYLSDPAAFRDAWRAALASAVPWTARERAERDRRASEAWTRCMALARERDILGRFVQAQHSRGVAGEARTMRLQYLIITSRFLEQPVSAAIKGPSSGGKSYTTERTLDFFPPSAFYALSAMSERALAYSEEPLQHRILVIYEAAGVRGDFASYLVRSLLSEGRVRYETVEKTKEGLRPRLIEREGPTGLLVTTTAVVLHAENETRLLSIPVTDTPQQTRDVLRAIAAPRGEAVDLGPWRALQEWLADAEHRVCIPYAAALAEQVPPVAVRLRRDFGMALNLIRAHALLHQASRGRDDQGQIVATLDDYAAVRALVADLLSDGVGATVPATVRKTVAEVAAVVQEGQAAASVSAVARRMRLDKSSVSRRAADAVEHGYLKNEETAKGKPARLTIGEPLPEDVAVLPSVEALRECCSVASVPEGIDAPPPAEVPNGLASSGGDGVPIPLWVYDRLYPDQGCTPVPPPPGLSREEMEAVVSRYRTEWT